MKKEIIRKLIFLLIFCILISIFSIESIIFSLLFEIYWYTVVKKGC